MLEVANKCPCVCACVCAVWLFCSHPVRQYTGGRSGMVRSCDTKWITVFSRGKLHVFTVKEE